MLKIGASGERPAAKCVTIPLEEIESDQNSISDSDSRSKTPERNLTTPVKLCGLNNFKIFKQIIL